MLIFMFVLGACVASFASALAWRLYKGRDFISDRSECEHCRHKLSAVDLMPIVSWLLLKGRCRYCHKPVAVREPLFELAGGLLFAFSYAWWPEPLGHWHQALQFGFWIVYLVGILALFMYDLRYYLLPDKLTFPLIGLVAIDVILNRLIIGGGGWSELVDALGGAALIAGFFWLLFAVSKGKWVGLGDAKLGVFMGLVLGTQKSLIALAGSYYLGALIILPLLIARKVTRKSHIPFGPFLLTSFFLSYFFGEQVVRWLGAFIVS